MANATYDDVIIAEDALIVNVQFAIHNLLEAKGMSRAELARALGVSEARVSQLFDDNPKNLTLRTIARIFYVLGEEPQITCPTLQSIIPVKGIDQREQPRGVHGNTAKAELMFIKLREENHARSLFEHEANDNVLEDDLVAA